MNINRDVSSISPQVLYEILNMVDKDIALNLNGEEYVDTLYIAHRYGYFNNMSLGNLNGKLVIASTDSKTIQLTNDGKNKLTELKKLLNI